MTAGGWGFRISVMRDEGIWTLSNAVHVINDAVLPLRHFTGYVYAMFFYRTRKGIWHSSYLGLLPLLRRQGPRVSCWHLRRALHTTLCDRAAWPALPPLCRTPAHRRPDAQAPGPDLSRWDVSPAHAHRLPAAHRRPGRRPHLPRTQRSPPRRPWAQRFLLSHWSTGPPGGHLGATGTSGSLFPALSSRSL